MQGFNQTYCDSRSGKVEHRDKFQGFNGKMRKDFPWQMEVIQEEEKTY